MKLPAGIEKWGSVVLGVLSLLLVANLVGQYRGMQPGNSRANPAPASASPQRAGKAPLMLPTILASTIPPFTSMP